MAKKSKQPKNHVEPFEIVIVVLSVPAIFGINYLESHHPTWYSFVGILFYLMFLAVCGGGAWLGWCGFFATMRSPANQFTRTMGGKVRVGLNCFLPLYLAVMCSAGVIWSIVIAARFIYERI